MQLKQYQINNTQQKTNIQLKEVSYSPYMNLQSETPQENIGFNNDRHYGIPNVKSNHEDKKIEPESKENTKKEVPVSTKSLVLQD